VNIEQLRKILPYTTVAVVAAALYTAYTFYSRSDEQARVEQAATQREAEAGRDSLNRVGGGDLKILQFLATPAVVKHGGSAKLCYGVAFAKTVRIEPETEAIWPSMGRCIDIKASKTTHYTLTAEDGRGHKAEQSTDVEVQ
jgi:hypothetical protein